MKKKFTLLLLAILSLAMSVSAQNTMTFQWAHSVDGATKAGDNLLGMCKSSDGNYFVATTFGTSDSQDARGLWIDGNLVDNVEGSPYTGTSQNGNLVLQKLDKNGNVAWMIYTDAGDVDHNATQIAPTSDGGAIMAIKTRAWVEEAGLDVLAEFVVPNGEPVKVSDSETQEGEYRYVIAKFSSDGQVVWTKVISGTVKTDTKYATKNNIYVNGLAVDDDDNIYIAGNYRTDMKFTDADGNVSTTLTAQNSLLWNGSSAGAWDGDSQKVVGDLFLVKLDSNGYFVKSLLADCNARCAFFDNIVYNDGKVYLNGRVQAEGSTFSLDGKSISASDTYQTQIFASVNTADLSVNYLSSLVAVPNSASRFIIQNKSAQYLNGSVYFTGLLNGSWKQEGESENMVTNHTSKMLKGYVLKMNPETGKIEKAAIRTDGGIGGFFGVYEGAEKLYAFGYDMSTGTIVAPIDKDTYDVETPIQVCTYGTTTIMTTPIVDGENFIMANRGGKANATNNVASFYGTDKTFENLKCWGSVYYSYKMSDVISTGINKPVASDVASDNKVDVYTLGGTRVKSGAAASNATEGLAKGIYIVNHKKVVVK